ncbi:aminotransferase class I/II-fold pyridoxal phosphate-dependent enzyme [Candidatus Woesearchaeota archaeon]|nr:aminotransferase class I/II-fold pyridoxal phosphate-dependent enzyme [Candidatus Woesearchaeota archaeon]
MKALDLKHGETYLEVLNVQDKLEKAISLKHRVSKSRVLLNNGSNGSLVTVFSAYAHKFLKERGRVPTILLDVPNYFRTLHVLNQWGYQKIVVKREENFNLNMQQYLETYIKKKPDMVIITTPNNPTGRAFTDEELTKCLNLFLKKSIVVIDRTLININKAVSTTELLQRYAGKNLIILESFSKQKSLADERIGYAVTASKEIADFIKPKLTLGYNVHAMKLALERINDEGLLERNRQRLVESIVELKFLPKNLHFFGSVSNYGIIAFPNGGYAETAMERLKKKGIYVMPGKGIGLRGNMIRIHMSGRNAIGRLIREIKRMKC